MGVMCDRSPRVRRCTTLGFGVEHLRCCYLVVAVATKADVIFESSLILSSPHRQLIEPNFLQRRISENLVHNLLDAGSELSQLRIGEFFRVLLRTAVSVSCRTR